MGTSFLDGWRAQLGNQLDMRLHEGRIARDGIAGVVRWRSAGSPCTMPAGSLLADREVHPRVAMQILRHAQFSITMEIYTQVSATTRRRSRGLGRPSMAELLLYSVAVRGSGRKRIYAMWALRRQNVRRQGLEPRTRGLRVRRIDGFHASTCDP